MQTYLAGNDVIVHFDLIDAGGAPVTGYDTASFTVTDAAGRVVTPTTDITPDGAATFVDVSVAAADNAVGQGDVRAIRTVTLKFTNGGVTRQLVVDYMIEFADALVTGINSFQTWNESLLTGMDLANIDTLVGSQKATAVSALINAFYNVCSLSYAVWGCDPSRPVSRHRSRGPTILPPLSSIGVDRMLALPPRFLKALRQAQMVEANELLDPSSVFAKRQAGLMSETIGESSMMFRPTKILQSAVTRRSMDILKEFISWELGIGRA